MQRATFATPPLCVAHEYDGSLQADVYLHDPLWVARPAEDRTVQAITVLSQLESLCRRIQILGQKADSGQMASVLQQEQDLIRKLEGIVGEPGNLKMFLVQHPLGQLSPRLLARLGVGPTPAVEKRTSYENYLLHMNFLNQIMSLGLQLRANIKSPSAHKYIAHQLALLYQSIAAQSPTLDSFKLEIERRFASVKASVRGADGIARLPRDQADWLFAMTTRLLQEIAQLPDGLVAPMETFFACMDAPIC
eukprot:m.20078 g.20078  ORF g.20078 m.20078 type:complete len:249 (+) comp3500_c0_seq2:32-778(+)